MVLDAIVATEENLERKETIKLETQKKRKSRGIRKKCREMLAAKSPALLRESKQKPRSIVVASSLGRIASPQSLQLFSKNKRESRK